MEMPGVAGQSASCRPSGQARQRISAWASQQLRRSTTRHFCRIRDSARRCPPQKRPRVVIEAVLTPIKDPGVNESGEEDHFRQPVPANAARHDGILSSVASAPSAMAGMLWYALDEFVWKSPQASGSAASATGQQPLPRKSAAPAPPPKSETGERSDGPTQDSGKYMDISSYLQTSGTLETRYLRMLSSLNAWTYDLGRLTPRTLYRMHRLDLVTSSRACELPSSSPAEAAQTREDMDCEGAVTASCFADWDSYSDELEDELQVSAVSEAQLPATLNNVAPLPASALASLSLVQRLSPREIMGMRLGQAAALAGRAGEAVIRTARAPFARNVAEQLQHAAEEGGQGVNLKKAMARTKASQEGCPCEWFVCDDAVSHTRYFVIQGSETLGSWITNVTFDPIEFEDSTLGVKVHRGVYNVALALYDRMLPLVEDHLTTSPFATVTFSGHSLGGALATVLMLMFVNRGVLDRTTISPCYTFGGAAVFCETGGVTVVQSDVEATVTASQEEDRDRATSDLLTRLNLPEGSVRNLVMHRDIVPRAFACDYSLVAPVLYHMSPFRDHATLHDTGVLYSFVGRMMVLQPGEDLEFTRDDGPHPMLPEGPGLYTLRDPALLCKRNGPCRFPMQDSHSRLELRRAVMAFMDNPHPLDTLADRRAYGHDGQISRYHNPDNYTKALGGVLRARRKQWSDVVSPASLRSRATALVSKAASSMPSFPGPGRRDNSPKGET